jgi:hypothetical protein
MICPNCQMQWSSGYDFCGDCGSPLTLPLTGAVPPRTKTVSARARRKRAGVVIAFPVLLALMLEGVLLYAKAHVRTTPVIAATTTPAGSVVVRFSDEVATRDDSEGGTGDPVAEGPTRDSTGVHTGACNHRTPTSAERGSCHKGSASAFLRDSTISPSYSADSTVSAGCSGGSAVSRATVYVDSAHAAPSNGPDALTTSPTRSPAIPKLGGNRHRNWSTLRLARRFCSGPIWTAWGRICG